MYSIGDRLLDDTFSLRAARRVRRGGLHRAAGAGTTYYVGREKVGRQRTSSVGVTLTLRLSWGVVEKNCRALAASTGLVFTGLNAKEVVRTWRPTRTKTSMVTLTERCQLRCDEYIQESCVVRGEFHTRRDEKSKQANVFYHGPVRLQVYMVSEQCQAENPGPPSNCGEH